MERNSGGARAGDPRVEEPPSGGGTAGTAARGVAAELSAAAEAAAEAAAGGVGALRSRAVALLQSGRWSQCVALLEESVVWGGADGGGPAACAGTAAEGAGLQAGGGGGAEGGAGKHGSRLRDGGIALGTAADTASEAAGGGSELCRDQGQGCRGVEAVANDQSPDGGGQVWLQLLLAAKLHEAATSSALPGGPPEGSLGGPHRDPGCGGAAGADLQRPCSRPDTLNITAAAAAELLSWAAALLRRLRPGGVPGAAATRERDVGSAEGTMEHGGCADGGCGVKGGVSSGLASRGGGGAAGGNGPDGGASGGAPQGRHEVRRLFRRLAVLVHPDKARGVVPEAVAAEAFRLLQQGCDKLLRERGAGPGSASGVRAAGGAGSSSSGRKRRRHARQNRHGDGGGGYDSGACGGDGGGNWSTDGASSGEGEVAEGEAWWSEWQFPPSPGSGGAGGSLGGRSTCPAQEDEEPQLWEMSLQELELEVALRQASVLRPPPGSEAAAWTITARQRRLRVARTVLSERTRAAAAAAVAAGGGGHFHGGGAAPWAFHGGLGREAPASGGAGGFCGGGGGGGGGW